MALQQKNTGRIIFAVLFVLSLLTALYALFAGSAEINGDRVYKSVIASVKSLEKDLENRIRQFEARGAYLYERFAAGKLKHGEMLPREALVIAKEGNISTYFGEIYHFEARNLARGEWCLIEISGDIFFLKKYAPRTFYVNVFFNIESNFLLADLEYKFSFVRLRFFNEKTQEAAAGSYRYEKEKGLFSYNCFLKHTNGQILLQLRFSEEEARTNSKRKRQTLLYITILVFLLLNTLYLRTASAPNKGPEKPGTGRGDKKASFFSILLKRIGRKRTAAALCWLAVLVDLFFLLSLVRESNLYLEFFDTNIEFTSTYQLLVVLLFFVSLLYFLRDRLKSKINYIVFNLSLIFVFGFSNRILQAVNFIYADFNFSFDYLSLIVSLLLLHLLPLFFIRGAAHPAYEGSGENLSNRDKQKASFFSKLFKGVYKGAAHPAYEGPEANFPDRVGRKVGFFNKLLKGVYQVAASAVHEGPGRIIALAAVQGVMALLLHYVFKLALFNVLVFSLVLFVLPAFPGVRRGRFFSRLAVVFLLALSIAYLTAFNSVKDKKEFITHNLKNIFLNQDNYARFIAREMIHEIHSRSSSLVDFFQECTDSKLVDIWRMSIAQRENIASGIFLLSKDGEITCQYSYQMPFIKLPTQKFFPFWAIEDTAAELFGKEISLAIASAGVQKRNETLGYIIIQVLNSPRLILRHQDRFNIFTIDKKINGRDLSYIKLNEENHIVENPSNINLQDVAGILENNNRWIKFKHTGLSYNGYIFKHSRGNSVIIFFPGNTIFKNFSGVIKIFLFLFFLFLLFYFRELRKIEWKSIYYSFSIRVFSLLTLISLLTAVIFSLFSLNFNLQSSQRKLRQVEYEKGTTAQNIAFNLLGEESGEINQDHLLLMSELSNSDVSVYEKGILLDSSNQRKLINAEIPIYLNSHVLHLLEEQKQKFVLSRDGYTIFFRTADYIFAVEFSYSWRKILSERSFHTDFIITLFFILAVIGLSTAFFFRGKIISPINELNRGMAEVEKGNLEPLKRVPPEIELKSLYLGFNSMIEGIRREKQNISELSRMKAIIRMGRRVAHEVKNPLTPIKLSAEQILKSLLDKNPGYEEIIKKSVNFIMDETEHLRKVSYGFLDLSRMDEVLAVEFDLLALVKEEVFNFSQVYGGVEFFAAAGSEAGGYNVFLDKIKIKQVLVNVLLNAIEAIGDRKGRIMVNLRDQGERVQIEVIDDGVGMDEEELDLIFDIDYSTKEIGTGIGLFIVKRIVDLHKGRIEIKSEKDVGTTIVLDLPKNVEKAK